MKTRYFIAVLVGFLVGVAITSIAAVLQVNGIINLVSIDTEWSIGIYSSSSSAPLNFSDENVTNPVLTANDVSDVPAKFVADPFLFHD